MFRRTLALLVVLGVGTIAGATPVMGYALESKKELSQTPTKQSAGSFSNYVNSNYGIRIKYPTNWSKLENFMGLAAVLFQSPTESSSDKFRENLNIVFEDISAQPMTLEEYTELNVNQIRQLVTNFNLIDSSRTTVANSPAYKLVYTGKPGVFNLKWMQIYTIKNNKAYVITYTAEVNKYSSLLGTIQQMIDSFKVD